MPVLTLQTEGDGVVVPENESAYKMAVVQAADAALLRRTVVDRVGHCAFTPGETLAALRPRTIHLIGNAQALGSDYNPFSPAYAGFTPAPYLRTDNGVPPDRAVHHLHREVRRNSQVSIGAKRGT